MAICYRDKGGVLHVVDKEVFERDYAVGRIVEIEGIEYKGGYPCIEMDGEYEPIVDYGNGETYVTSNARDGIPLADMKEPHKSQVVEILAKIGL